MISLIEVCTTNYSSCMRGIKPKLTSHHIFKHTFIIFLINMANVIIIIIINNIISIVIMTNLINNEKTECAHKDPLNRGMYIQQFVRLACKIKPDLT